jgi:hypothetical protein
VSLDVASAYAALSDEFTPDPDTVRALGMAGSVLSLTGLIGGGVLVAATTRIAQQARAMPTWAVWASYAVAGPSLTGFWSGGWRLWPSRCGFSAPSSGCCARRVGHRRCRPSRAAGTDEQARVSRGFLLMGDGGLEPPTSSLSEKRSNRLS